MALRPWPTKLAFDASCNPGRGTVQRGRDALRHCDYLLVLDADERLGTDALVELHAWREQRPKLPYYRLDKGDILLFSRRVSTSVAAVKKSRMSPLPSPARHHTWLIVLPAPLVIREVELPQVHVPQWLQWQGWTPDPQLNDST